MSDTQLLERITTNPEVMGGKPVIKGTRLTVDCIRGRVARGATVADLLREYEGLVADDILACLLFPETLPSSSGTARRGMFDLGHQGDVDYTQIIQLLKLTPEERLERHEGWRLFVKEALRNAAIRQGNDREAVPGTG
jgi:uncharacterized protein (DUF433 family)